MHLRNVGQKYKKILFMAESDIENGRQGICLMDLSEESQLTPNGAFNICKHLQLQLDKGH